MLQPLRTSLRVQRKSNSGGVLNSRCGVNRNWKSLLPAPCFEPGQLQSARSVLRNAWMLDVCNCLNSLAHGETSRRLLLLLQPLLFPASAALLVTCRLTFVFVPPRHTNSEATVVILKTGTSWKDFPKQTSNHLVLSLRSALKGGQMAGDLGWVDRPDPEAQHLGPKHPLKVLGLR